MDYKQLIDNLSIDAVIRLMQKLGATDYKEEEDFIIFPTICHNENEVECSRKLYFYKNTKLFVCYTNCHNMSIFNFLKHYYETRNIEYDWYNDIFLVVKRCSDYNFEGFEGMQNQSYKKLKETYGNHRKIVTLDEYSKGVLDTFVKIYPIEWLNDGITKEAMDKFNISYSISQNKIIIPHFDVNGRLVGIRGRALDPWEIENIGKYMPIKVEEIWYKHSLMMNLYGLYENKNNIKKSGVCYVCEGEKSVLQAEAFSAPNCAVAVCGSQFNKFQLNLLLQHCSPQEIVICFDQEELPKENKYFLKLYNLCSKYINYCNFSFIYDREKILKLKESPTDRGEEIFNELVRKRVKVK